ncbi:hypothetical protein Agub_g350, partial [Astrephomene gubernaculifera]
INSMNACLNQRVVRYHACWYLELSCRRNFCLRAPLGQRRRGIVAADSLNIQAPKPSKAAEMSQHAFPQSLSVWWVRRDLRLADNEALTSACEHGEALLPVFCFDPRDIQPRRQQPEGLGVPKLGPFRCRFLLESLRQLRCDLQRPAGQSPLLQQQQPHEQSGWRRAAEEEGARAAEAQLGGTLGGISSGSARTLHASKNISSSSGGDAGGSRSCRPGSDDQGAGGSAGEARVCDSSSSNSNKISSSNISSSSSDLVVRWGRAEQQLPLLLEAVVGANTGLRCVSL